ncbi:MAG: 16S rRNA (cytosine(1402)-N(4))-methyltransferase RsmH [Bdellovibrionales bacterium]|nr:16S rRNA (cytosine(1402)-N(4))-methyltransferase RsmH [Bdellovibrionales bacterium]
MEHIPVLLEPVLNMAKTSPHTPKLYLDGTFGRGGHARALMNEFSELKVIAFDQDPEAIEYAKTHFKEELSSGRLQILKANFHDVTEVCKKLRLTQPFNKFDFMLIDLGVSSPQLDDPRRGFSFYHDGPLDMRMDLENSLTAAEIINTWSEDELRDLFYHYGEVRKPGRVVHEILNQRQKIPFQTTRQLSSLIEKSEGWRKKGQHPATQFFLALRMAVNAELEPLAKAIEDLVLELAVGGRLVVLTFHSLEDRIVKQQMKSMKELGSVVNKKVVQATWDEKKVNSRARSAKLRTFQRGEIEYEKTSN